MMIQKRQKLLLSRMAVLATLALSACQPQKLSLVGNNGRFAADEEGALVAFIMNSGEASGDIYVFDPVAEITIQVTKGGKANWVSWSATGIYLVIEALRRVDDRSEDLYLLNTTSGDLTDLTEQLPYPGSEISLAVWSPVEDRLAFVYESSDGQPHRLYLVDAASGDITEINLPEGKHSPYKVVPYNSLVWSPDGAQLAFDTIDGEVYVIRTQTGEVSYLADGFWPVWSPDGTEIAYSDLTSGDIAVMSEESGDVRLVGTQRSGKSHIVWSPDGQYLAFVEDIRDGWGGIIDQNLYVTDFEETRLVNDDINPFSWSIPLTWSPDSTTLVSSGGALTNRICWASIRQEALDCSFDAEVAVISPDFEWIAYRLEGKLCARLLNGEEHCTETFNETLFPLGWRP